MPIDSPLEIRVAYFCESIEAALDSEVDPYQKCSDIRALLTGFRVAGETPESAALEQVIEESREAVLGGPPGIGDIKVVVDENAGAVPVLIRSADWEPDAKGPPLGAKWCVHGRLNCDPCEWVDGFAKEYLASRAGVR